MSKISIITPSYNSGMYIERAIQSVINQNYSLYEHIVIDGGSTDNTIDVLKKYDHIRWVSEKDRGQSHAMNKGLKLASGKIVGFLNADDAYNPNIFAKVAEAFNQTDTFFLCGVCEIVNDESQIIGTNKTANLSFKNIYTQYLKWGMHNSLFPFNPVAYFYVKSLHNEVGNYNEDNHYTMDFDFLLRVLKHGISFNYSNEIFGKYYQISGTKTVEMIAAEGSKNLIEQVLREHYYALSLSERILLQIKSLKKNKRPFLT